VPETANAGSPSRVSRFFSRSRIGVAFALAAIAATAYTFWPRTPSPFFFFEVTMRSSLPGSAQLYYDIGSGHNEKDSFRLPVEGGDREIAYKFPLPEGTFANLRFDPTDRAPNTISLTGARIVDRSGTLIRAIGPSQIKASQQVEQLEAGETAVTFTTAATADPILRVELAEPVTLKSYARPSLRKLLRRFLNSLAIFAVLGLLIGPALLSTVTPPVSRLTRKTAAWGRAYPRQLLLATAAAAVVLSCYPIVFFGKSFLSPNNHSRTYLLYGEMPTVPGSSAITTDDEKGSDLGASMLYSWPNSVVQSRALLKHFELPLWNRYDSSGLPLLGQGQSMFGDPLHFLVLLTNGSSGWWDVKYLLAKFLFAASLGFSVLQLTKHLPAAIIISLTAPFIGFFSYRYSHPAFFSMCYAPFILLCWFKVIDAPKGRLSALWLGMMVLANWMVMNSGTVKEAYILLLTLNLCGCLTLLLASSVVEKVAKLRQALFAQLLFVLIATPVWLTFLNTLRSSWTSYDAAVAFQIQPGLLIGLFDDIFYRQFNTSESHLDPSANFLVLAGVLWFGLSPHRIDHRKLSRGLILTCLLAVAMVFGVVPPSLIARIPFLGRIHHVDNTFSCVAIVSLIVLAGFGIKAFWNDCQTSNFKRIYFRLLATVGGLIAIYLGTTEAAQRSNIAFLQLGTHIAKSPFFWGYTFTLIAALAVAPWIFRRVIRADRAWIWQPLSLGLIFLLLHWRHGMHLATPFDAYVMNPQPRANLIADASPALGLIRKAAKEPSRTAGLNYNLNPGYGSAIELEMIDSPNPLLNKHYKSLIDAFGVTLIFNSSRSGVIGPQLEHDLSFFDMLNVRYYLGNAGTKADVIPSLQKVAALDLNVYESSKVWPRAFFADRASPYGSESEFVRLVKEGDGKPFVAVPQGEVDMAMKATELSDSSSASADRQIVPATDYALTNNTTSFKIAAPTKGIVVLTEPYVDGDFELRVNGQPASYFRVNSAFRGVFVPAPGNYHFSFAYWPRRLTISLWIAGFGIILLLCWLRSVFKYSSREA
jgi:hypothetical protein